MRRCSYESLHAGLATSETLPPLDGVVPIRVRSSTLHRNGCFSLWAWRGSPWGVTNVVKYLGFGSGGGPTHFLCGSGVWLA